MTDGYFVLGKRTGTFAPNATAVVRKEEGIQASSMLRFPEKKKGGAIFLFVYHPPFSFTLQLRPDRFQKKKTRISTPDRHYGLAR